MKNALLKRSAAVLAALVMLLGTLPFGALAAQSRFTLIPLEKEDVTLEGSIFPYTGREIRPQVTVRVRDQLLTQDKDYTLEYSDNIEVGTGLVTVTGIATAAQTHGYTGILEIPFEITEAITLEEDHVALEGSTFPYTGTYVEPRVTVTVGGRELVRDRDYTLRYFNNIGAGTATASVTGLESAGYTGQVNVSFTIARDPQIPAFQLITLTEENVKLEGSSFPYTGKAVEPKVTVTAADKVLSLGTDYALTYEDNLRPGTGYALVRGIATASETLGYAGEVKIPFTIEKAPEETKPEETLPEQTEPTQPEETQPEQTEPGQTQPEEVSYRITKGDNAVWYHDSAVTLSFTADADYAGFEGVQIDGKDLPARYYTAKKGTTVTLKSAFLQKLDAGKHTIAILFEDGQAQGSFRVREAVDPTNPATADRFPLGTLLGVMGLSLAAGSALIVFRKKIFK